MPAVRSFGKIRGVLLPASQRLSTCLSPLAACSPHNSRACSRGSREHVMPALTPDAVDRLDAPLRG